MGLDIRLPLGLIFLITGGIMLLYGLLTLGSSIYSVSLGVNLNVTWGAVMMIFGAVMLLAAKRARR